MCFTSFRLLELGVGRLGRTIVSGYRHVVASTSLLGRLPVVDKLATRGVVAEARAARRQELDGVLRCAGIAADLQSLQWLVDVGRTGKFGVAREELELDRHG